MFSGLSVTRSSFCVFQAVYGIFRLTRKPVTFVIIPQTRVEIHAHCAGSLPLWLNAEAPFWRHVWCKEEYLKEEEREG